MIWAVLVLVVPIVVLAGLVTWDDRRHARRVRELAAQTPTPMHGFHGGPTQYDEHGRVVIW